MKMREDSVRFEVSRLDATVPEGVPVRWQGTEFNSGPLEIELDRDGDGRCGQGLLDYSRRRARAEFRIRLAFPELAATLESLGADSSLTEPVRAVLSSEGEILEDHTFVLSGRCELASHEVLSSPETAASV